MATRSKFFRVATEGATTDGRTIERAQIEQMAAQYNPTLYGARVNLEHFRGILPDGPFRAYGDVIALEAREVDGGKLGLFAQIEPTQDLIAMTRAKQKVYTSIEIDPSFADTKQAYLVGLAVTDSPASLGTEILSFAAQNPAASPFAGRKLSPQNLFTASVEIEIELEAETTTAAPSVFSKVAELLGLVKKKTADDDTRLADVTQAVEALATHSAAQAQTFATERQRLDAAIAALNARTEASEQAFSELHTKLSTTGDGSPTRPPATGGTGAIATDC